MMELETIPCGHHCAHHNYDRDYEILAQGRESGKEEIIKELINKWIKPMNFDILEFIRGSWSAKNE